MAIERTLSIIKPDAVAKNVIGQIVSRFEGAGLKVAAAKLVHLLAAARQGQISGVGLKDEHDEHAALPAGCSDPSQNFLLGH